MMTALRAASGSAQRRQRFHATASGRQKDDARYLTPIVGTPGYRHTIGVARVWHFINVHGFIITGIVFITMLFSTEQWKRIVPISPLVVTQAWNTWVHYATFHMPAEPNGFYGYNALQQIAYFAVIFVFGPTAILTGMAMSPAVVNRSPWYARLFGGRQSARSIHFLTMLSFLAFLVVHVTLVVMTGFARNMNHIVLGTDAHGRIGIWLSFCGITVVVLSWVVAHWLSWRYGMHPGVYWPRILSAALSLSATGAIMVLLRADHPPAGATTLIVSLGIISKPKELVIIEVAVLILVAQVHLINSMAGLPYPLWTYHSPTGPT